MAIFDHAKSAREVAKMGVPIFATKQTIESVGLVGHHSAREILVRMTFSVGSFSVMPFEAVHDAPGTVGFWIEDMTDGDKLVFLTDSAFAYYTFPGTNIYMVEANFSEQILQRNVEAGLIDAARARRVRENHMSIERVVEMLRVNDLSNCRAIHLLHGSDGNSDAIQFKRMVEEATGIPTTVEG